MKTVMYPEREQYLALSKRPQIEKGILRGRVQEIIQSVKLGGDAKLLELSREFDSAKLESIQLTKQEIEGATVSEPLANAIKIAKQNVEKFHNSQKDPVQKIKTTPGVTCWRKSLPIERVGLYVPGGTASLFSSLLMLAIPAKIAGCKDIVVCTPAKADGKVDATVLYIAKLLGITDIYKLGGAQAIAAMAYGTESISPVQKIFGPGNQYVTEAKSQVMQDSVAIDLPAGPTELLLIADEFAKPEYLAADILAQAEHGADSQIILITTSKEIETKTKNAVVEQLETLPRKNIAAMALENSKIIIVSDLEEAFVFSNNYAPEHLILNIKNAEEWAEKVTAAGSVFIGEYAAESFGDYSSGTNHTLPTSGAAGSYSGVSLDSFVKKITYQTVNKAGLNALGPATELMAEAEGLLGHKRAVSIRLATAATENGDRDEL